MEIEDILRQKKKLHSLVLVYIENDDDYTHDFEELTKFITASKILKSKQSLEVLFHIILSISKNHRRESHFFEKIIQIFIFLLPTIHNFFSNIEIFDIFKANKLLLLFLFQNEIISIDFLLINHISTSESDSLSILDFLYPIFKPYLCPYEQRRIEKDIFNKSNDDLKTFEEKCQKGVNDSYICQLIQKDQIVEFIIYVNETNIKLDSTIPDSIYETSDFLIDKSPTLIEYSSFCGSIQIFKYLLLENVKIQPTIWKYAIHGFNPEIIQIILDEKIEPEKNQDNDNPFYDLLLESIECHHNKIASFILENNPDLNDCEKRNDYLLSCFRSYNFLFLPELDFDGIISLRCIFRDQNLIFNEIASLKIITIPSTKKVIEKFQFSEFTGMEKVIIPDSITSIGQGSFSKCFSLKEIIIPKFVVSIGKNAFEHCSSLKKIVIPPSVISIGSGAFSNCTSLKKIVIPSSIVSISEYVFSGCSSLRKISIPSSITSIGDKCFSRCLSLETVIFEKKSKLESIGSSCFYDCKSLKEIEIPSSITLIKNHTFYNCTSLTNIIIPDSVTQIGEYSFNQCSSLKSISSSAKSIGFFSFSRCESLENVNLPFLTKINAGSFSYCSMLKEIEISPSVESIGSRSFYHCKSLKLISIPNSVKIIGQGAFNGCQSLEKISIPFSVVSIGDESFSDCSSLEEISIPSSIESITQNTFANCKSLKRVLFENPSSLSYIGYNAFVGCSSLNEMELPSSVKSVDSNAFKDCSLIQQNLIPSNLFVKENKRNEFNMRNQFHVTPNNKNKSSWGQQSKCSTNILDVPQWISNYGKKSNKW